MPSTKLRRALISVTDKTQVVEFALELQNKFGFEIISTGGTARTLVEAGVKVVPIEQHTGFPEMMDGRVKTLHPLVHGGLLARRDNPEHMADAERHKIGMIDLVCVNLYAFEQTAARPGVSFAEVVENIDIGGPSMLRSSAKNHEFVTVVSSPEQYSEVLQNMAEHEGETTPDLRRRLAYECFARTAAYDQAIASWFESQLSLEDGTIDLNQDKANQVLKAQSEFPEELNIRAKHALDLRYGENPHQSAAFYCFDSASEHSLAKAQLLQGKPLSYNNLLDTSAAWSLVCEFEEPAAIVLKHQNPCGSAIGSTITEAYDRAYACDPVSAYGGIIALNKEVPLDLIEHAVDVNKQFVEVIIAPSFSKDALARLSKRPNLRVLATGGIDRSSQREIRTIDGGLLVQDIDHVSEDPANFSVPTKAKPSEEQMRDLLFAWRVCKGVKSNAILIARDLAGIGLGPGQPNRVDSAIMACERAHAMLKREGLEAKGLACASDAFFPFRDDVDELAKRGVTCIIQPGGSIRDEEVIAACDEYGIAMVFTGHRHFCH